MLPWLLGCAAFVHCEQLVHKVIVEGVVDEEASDADEELCRVLEAIEETTNISNQVKQVEDGTLID